MERAPRTAGKTSFFHAEPLAWWLSAVLVLFALVTMMDDLRYLLSNFSGSAPLEIMFAVDSVLSYAVIGLVAWRSTWASVASISCLISSLILHDNGAAIIAAAVVTVSVLATATDRFIRVHLLVYFAWVVAAASVREGGFDGTVFWNLLIPLLLVTLVGGAVRYFAQQRRRSEQRVRDLEILNVRLREDERQALARDLHDVVAHELTLITMQTMSRRRSGDVGELHQVLETVEGAARSALHELRVMLRLLRNENEGEHPRDVTGAGLSIGSLEHVVTSLAASLRDLRFEPEVVITGDLEAMPTTVRGTAARILQEAVTNIIKYAPAGSRCRIEVTADEHELCLRVANPLPRSTQRLGSHSSVMSSGLGLRGITERVSLLGGHAESGAADGQWVLDVCLPVDRREAL
ncbi:histidine kinase [Kocuria sp. CPCC 205258]|uniref:sensor histidine kinase n=1 Tax=Kocuria sp. CPCC 205258 TaxID=3073552 RepID=UPI0034D75AF4